METILTESISAMTLTASWNISWISSRASMELNRYPSRSLKWCSFGRVNVKRLPSPTRLVTFMKPPCCSMMFFTIASPKPTPSPLLPGTW